MSEIKGAPEFLARLRNLARLVPDEVDRAMYQEGLIEMKEMQRRTPVWNPARTVPKGVVPGALRGSYTIERVQNGSDVKVVIRCGGEVAPYAVWVHEDLEADHATGEAKFMESTLNESSPYLAERISKRIDMNRAVNG